MGKVKTLNEMEAKLKELQANVDALKKDIASDNERVFGFKVKPYSGEEYYLPSITEVVKRHWANVEICPHYDLPLFKTKEEAESFSDALRTMLLLRTMDGIVSGDFGVDKEYICFYDGKVAIPSWKYRRDLISPAFDTKESAQKAIDIIGEDRLTKMFKVLGAIS